MTCQHRWTYRNGRSYCPDCGAWAPDLVCCPGLRQKGNVYPTATDLQRSYTCPVCEAGIRTRMHAGELRVLCDGPETHDIIELGQVTHKRKRDYIRDKELVQFHDVMDGLPPELRKEMQKCL